MNNQTKKLMVIAAILGILCIVVGIIDLLPAGNSNQPGVYDETVGEEDVFNVVVPWEEEGAKQPEDYTKEEYEQLSPAQKDKFQNSFETEDEYHNWAEKENVVVEQYPWHTGGKKTRRLYTERI